MRAAVGGVVTIALLAACAPAGTGPAAKASPSVAASPAERTDLDRWYGSYPTADGGRLVVTRMGWFADLRDSTYRTLYVGGAPGRFTIGPAFRVPAPPAAVLDFSDDRLHISGNGRSSTESREMLKQTEVTISAMGAQLAGTITEPAGVGPHPGIVVVHGSEPGQRFFYDFWVGLYTGLGLTVLTYDKRGNGQSTGQYPGEYAAPDTLSTLADDATAALDFLAAWPGVDPRRVGFHGGSQGGWIVPLAILRHRHGAFAILVSAPAVTVGQQAVWNDFSSGGAVLPRQSADEMNTAVRNEHYGYDPAPALAALKIPSLWVLGRNDRIVPTAISVEYLTALKNSQLSISLVTSGHGLLLNRTGLVADDDKAPGLAPEVIPAISDWVKRVVA